MPDFDVFPFQILKKHNKRSHQMLSKLASLSISSLRKLDDEANKFYDRKHDLDEAALLTRCYTQHALCPYIDSEINHIRTSSKFHSLIKVLNS